MVFQTKPSIFTNGTLLGGEGFRDQPWDLGWELSHQRWDGCVIFWKIRTSNGWFGDSIRLKMRPSKIIQQTLGSNQLCGSCRTIWGFPGYFRKPSFDGDLMKIWWDEKGRAGRSDWYRKDGLVFPQLYLVFLTDLWTILNRKVRFFGYICI